MDRYIHGMRPKTQKIVLKKATGENSRVIKIFVKNPMLRTCA